MKTTILNLLLLSSCACGSTTTNSLQSIEYRNDTIFKQFVIQENTIDNGNLLKNDPKKQSATKTVNKFNLILKDSILIDIQNKITLASNESFVVKNTKNLDEIEKKLDTYYKKNNNKLTLYWKSYLLYYKSIFYLTTNDKLNSEKSLDSGIDIMENITNKNSDDFALLALLRGLSIQFKAGIKAPFISNKILSYLSQALELDSTNIRVYFVQGSNDFYTPKIYGGGKIVETSLIKAISLPNQNIVNSALPSWGKEEAYEMIIRYYINNKRWENAKKYYKDANNLYPENFRINKVALQLIGK